VHVAAAKGARGARVGGGVTVVSLVVLPQRVDTLRNRFVS
jgi:hypothetical protein